MKNDNTIFYRVVAFFAVMLGNIFFGGKVIGKDNIPKEGRCILAGNHVSNYDSYLLAKSTKRPIHMLGKKELFRYFGWFFKRMHVIKVDRKTHEDTAKRESIEVLNNNQVLGIFPEGTFKKANDLLPFKPGVISFAEKTNSVIIPFAIKGTFKFRSKPTIVFGKPIKISKINKEQRIDYLENKVKKLLK